MTDWMDVPAHWRHVITLILIILGVAVIFSLETHKPVDLEGLTVDATSILVLGG